MSRIGDLIRRERLRQGVSQGDLAKALNFESPQYISNVERGICLPTLGQAIKVCVFLNIQQGAISKALYGDRHDLLKKEFGIK